MRVVEPVAQEAGVRAHDNIIGVLPAVAYHPHHRVCAVVFRVAGDPRLGFELPPT